MQFILKGGTILYRLISIILMCFLLAACTKSNEMKTKEPKIQQVTQTINSNNTQNEEDDNFQIKGNVISSEQFITIQGTSNLYEGTELEVKIDTDLIKPAKVIVDKEGNFSVYIDNPPLETDTEMWMMMKPDKQSKELQEKYGVDGENIANEYQFEYESNGKKITGLVVNSMIDKIAPNIVGGSEKLIPGYE